MSFAAFEEAPNGESFAPTEEVDPAADFLARQQNQMADLELNDDENGTEQANNHSEPQSESQTNGSSETNGTNGDSEHQNGGNHMSDVYSAIQKADRLAKEPETIKKWREEFSQRIESKDEAEEKKRVELRDTAAKELVDWQRHYDEQLEKQRGLNREAEADFIKQRDESGPGSEWERVCWLCDFNPKTSKQVKDVSRMRSLLLQMKQQQQQSTA